MAGFNIKHWFADGAFRTIIRNSAWLGSSNVVSALLGLLALSCAGKGMTPAMFGVLVIVQSYAKSISDFIKFQTWQLVVQYGTPALTNNNPQQFRNVVSFSFSLDIVSGAVAIVGGIALLPFLSHSLGLDDQSFWLAALYCTLIPSMASSTPTGILRAVNRFDLIAVQQATKPFLRAAGSVVAWYFDFGFAGFVIAWYVSNLVGGTMYWWFAARELRRRNIHNAFKLNLFESARHIKGAWSFVWSTNIAHSIWSACNSCSTVLVGIVLGPAAAGLFKIAMTFFDAAGTPAGLLGKSFYPEVMRLDPHTTRPWLLGVKSGLLAGGIGILVALAVFIVGKPLISLVFGVKYLEAYDLIQVMLGAIVISMLGFPQESLLLMAGKQRAFLVAQTIASIGYIVLLFMFCHLFGVPGAAFAYFGGQCLDVVLSLIPTLKAFFQRHSLLKQMPGRVLISLLLSVTGLLSGCASHNENASLLAKKQAQNISQNLPIKSAGYTLVLAQSSGTTVKMTIISEAGTQTTQTPDAFLTSYQRQMCADPTVKLMITEGINYSITINDTRTGNQYQRKLDRTTCGIVKA